LVNAAPPTVHLLCGLNGAGKTSYARRLAEARGAVRFTLDEWLLTLHPETRYDAPEYGALAERGKLLIWDVAGQVLALGHDVILDWNSWSRARRATWGDRARAAGYEVVLHYVVVPLDVAIARAEHRAASGVAGAHRLDAAAVRHLASLFEVPTADEGLPIILVHDTD
jgi:predicted kinase